MNDDGEEVMVRVTPWEVSFRLYPAPVDPDTYGGGRSDSFSSLNIFLGRPIASRIPRGASWQLMDDHFFVLAVPMTRSNGNGR
jgi:hypothetical protein